MLTLGILDAGNWLACLSTFFHTWLESSEKILSETFFLAIPWLFPLFVGLFLHQFGWRGVERGRIFGDFIFESSNFQRVKINKQKHPSHRKKHFGTAPNDNFYGMILYDVYSPHICLILKPVHFV